MIRTLMMLVGLLSFVVLLCEAVGIGLLYSQGRLSKENLWTVRLMLEGREQDEPLPEPAETAAVSTEDVVKLRTLRALQLDTRENELKTLKDLAEEAAIGSIQERQKFDVMKEEFRKQLAELEARIQSDAHEQTRAILLASKPEDAVQRLMGLSLEESVELLQGIPEKTTAKILQSFAQTPETLQRGQEIFEALFRGGPKGPLVNDALKQLGPPPEVSENG